MLSVSKTFESVISDFNSEYEKRKLGLKRRRSSLQPQNKGKKKDVDEGVDLEIRHMSYESNDFAVTHVFNAEQDEIRDSIAHNPSEIVKMPNQEQGPPVLLTDFKVDCILGKGAFGQVYKVVH